MSGKKGGIKRGNKVVIRNHKSLKINDLKTNLLEPSAPTKTTSNHLWIRWLLVFGGAGGV